MDNKKVTPITRVNKWFSEEDFNLEIEMGREAIEGDGNFTLILYRVDRQLTESDDLYGESSADGIRYFLGCRESLGGHHVAPGSLRAHGPHHIRADGARQQTQAGFRQTKCDVVSCN